MDTILFIKWLFARAVGFYQRTRVWQHVLKIGSQTRDVIPYPQQYTIECGCWSQWRTAGAGNAVGS